MNSYIVLVAIFFYLITSILMAEFYKEEFKEKSKILLILVGLIWPIMILFEGGIAFYTIFYVMFNIKKFLKGNKNDRS